MSSGDCAFITSETGILTPWAAKTKGRGNGPTPRGQGTYLRAVLCLLVPIKSNADALSANGYSRFAVPRSPEQVLRDNYAAQDRKLDKCMGTRVKIYS